MALPQDIDDPKFEVVKIGPSFYRKLIIDENLKFSTDKAYEEEDDIENGELDEQMWYENNEWVIKLPVAAVFHRFIVGTKAAAKQKLEMDSGARIQVPNREDLEDAIWLRARTKQAIYSCKAQIELLCEKAETKLEFTHFLSLPLAHDHKFRQLVDGFREDVVMQRFPGIDASIFMPSRRMHFTVCMLKLHSYSQVEEMKQVLQEFSVRLAATDEYRKPLSASLRGLHIMTDDPSNVGVVFTTDRSSALQNRLNNVSDLLFTMLRDKNLVSSQGLIAQRLLSSDGAHAEVKLHATLMNTKYSKTSWQRDERGDRDGIDAGALMERFGPVHFGEVSINEMQLSCLDEMGDDGYYRSLLSVPMFNQR